jgi:MFS family permease
MAVDQALVTQVLPSARDRGRDLGILNVANALPYVLASVGGGIVINYAGGYLVLYLAAVVIGLAASVTVIPIRSVR